MKNAPYRCREARKASGLSIEQVANKADLSISTVCRILKKPDMRPSYYASFAAAVDADPGYLVFGHRTTQSSDSKTGKGDGINLARLQVEINKLFNTELNHPK